MRHVIREISRGTKKNAGCYRKVWNVFAEMKAAQIRLLLCSRTNIGMVAVNLYYSAAILCSVYLSDVKRCLPSSVPTSEPPRFIEYSRGGLFQMTTRQCSQISLLIIYSKGAMQWL